MPDYTVSTNLISWIPARHGLFGWPTDGQQAEVVREMQPGNLIVPKFAPDPVHGEQEQYQRGIAAVWDDSWDAAHDEYVDKVAWGAGAVPFVMRVVKQLADDDRFPSYPPDKWACAEVEQIWLEHPISTSDYLRMRVVPVELAGQFKAMAAPNRRIQALPDGAGQVFLQAGARPERDWRILRLEDFLASDTTVREIEQFPHFHDRYVLLPRKVTEAFGYPRAAD